MKIVLVTDSCAQLNNGTTMTTYRFAENLRKRGHEVVILASGEHATEGARVPEKQVPIVSYFCKKQGFALGTPDPALFRKVMEDADVVHFLLPLPFDKKALKVAKQLNKPVCGAFHLQPENVTYIIHMPFNWLAKAIYRIFDQYFYKEFTHIHCPSEFIAQELRKNGYQAKLHVISNGVDPAFCPAPDVQDLKGQEPDLIRIVMVGRLSPEKRQRVLIEAVNCSKYRDRIELILAGKGPMEEELRREGEKLPHSVKINFYGQEDLITLLRSCDLYVHASYIEIEAISCLEALSCGLVPVISNSPKSATRQFALDERSLFHADDAVDLASHIDYWIEHPEERKKMSLEYAKEGRRFGVEESARKAEEMFLEVIQEKTS